MPIDSSIPLAALGAPPPPLDILGMANQASMVHQRRAMAEQEQRKAQQEQQIQALAGQYADDPDTLVEQIRRIDPDYSAKLSERLWSGRREAALAHQAQTKSTMDRLSAGLQLLQGATPENYATRREMAAILFPNVAGQLPEQFDEAKLGSLMQMGMTTEKYLKAQQDAAELLIKGDARESLATLFSNSTTPEQWAHSQELAKQAGLGMLGKQFGEFSPENVQRAAALGITPNQALMAQDRAADNQRMMADRDAMAAERALDNKRADAHLRLAQGTAARLAQQAANPQTKTLSPTAESNIINRLSNQWTKAVQSQNEINRQVSVMEQGLAAGRRGDLPQANEAVLQTFLKILDPDSVVREGEFQRLREGASMTTRVQAAVQRLTQGGFLPMSELEKYAKLAKEVQASTKTVIEPVKTRIGKTADRYNIPRELVMDIGAGGAVEAAPAGVEVWQWEKGPDGKPRRKK